MTEISTSPSPRSRGVLRMLRDALPPSATEDNRLHETRGRHRLRAAIFCFYVTTAAAYFVWRLTVFNTENPFYSALFYAAELFSTVICFVIAFTGWRRITVPHGGPIPDVTVDVMITTYNEPVDVIRRTALGALAIEYPHKTWILDDGNRDEIRDLATEIGCNYLARTENKGAKAGNLNNGLKHSTGEIIVTLDADHVPQRNFLHETLGYFINPKMAMVQTVEDNFNFNSFQYGRDKTDPLIWNDQSVFRNVGQPGRNHWNAATWCGTSAVLRRSALEAIGGIAEETVTEDMHTAVKLQRAGHDTASHPTPLAYGIAPHGLAGFLRQRLRWGEGNMQVHREEDLPFSSGLTWGQSLCYSALAWNYLNGWQRFIYMLAPIILLFLQIPPFISDPVVFLAFFCPYIIFTFLLFEEFGRGYGRLITSEKFSVAQFVPGMLSVTGLFRAKIRFRVSSKEVDNRVPFTMVAPQVLVVGLCLAAIAFGGVMQWVAPREALPLWLYAFVGLLAAYNGGLALSVIVDTLRAARYFESPYRHLVDVPFRLELPEGSNVLLASRELSTEEIVFRPPAGFDVSGVPACDARIFLPGLNADIRLSEFSRDTRAGNPDVTARVEWAQPRQKDDADLVLHAGRWFRPIYGYRETSRTPYDILKDFLDNGSWRRPGRTRWKAVLWRRASAPEEDPRIGYVDARGPGESNVTGMIAFADTLPDEPVIVEVPGDAKGTARQCLLLSETDRRGTDDEDALGLFNGRMCRATVVPAAVTVSKSETLSFPRRLAERQAIVEPAQ